MTTTATPSTTVIARTYSRGTCYELVPHPRTAGRYQVRVNGQCQDARQSMSTQDARDWYDAAGIQIGERP